jgi:hypothetical protein
MQRFSKSLVTKALNVTGISVEEHESLVMQQKEIEQNIQALLEQRKRLELDVTQKQKKLTDARAKFKDVRAKKKKAETPILAELENILIEHNINAAAYHGRKLNGVDCCEFVQLSDLLFDKFEAVLLATTSLNRCSDDVITNTCALFRDICITLDSLSSKLRLKNGEPQEDNYVMTEKALKNLEYLWKIANLSFTPKIHCLLVHATNQMQH